MAETELAEIKNNAKMVVCQMVAKAVRNSVKENAEFEKHSYIKIDDLKSINEKRKKHVILLIK